MENTVVIIENKQPIVCEVNKVAIYAQGKVVECRKLDTKEFYYLFFYKNQFLTGRKTSRVKLGGFIETAMKQGIILHSPNPILNILLSNNQTFTLISFKKLLKKFEQQSTPQEIALIFSFFNDYITKDTLEKVIERQYFQYRRSGQLLYAYQILQIAKRLTSSKWAIHTSNQIEYQKYEKRYKQPLESILSLDPIFVELESYSNHTSEPSNQLLASYYMNENRAIDLIALSMNHFSLDPSPTNYHKFTHYLHKYCNQSIYLEMLKFMYKQFTTLLPLKQELIKVFLERQDYQEIIELLIEQSTTLDSDLEANLKSALTSQDVLPQVVTLNKANHGLIALFKTEPNKLEHILSRSVTILLDKHSILYITKWLAPLKQEGISLPLLNKIEIMETIHDDPDKQFLLGEHYYDLHHVEKAIECFNWEMEINPTDPQPVRWLSKLYQELGMTSKSKDYQQVFLSMQKYA